MTTAPKAGYTSARRRPAPAHLTKPAAAAAVINASQATTLITLPATAVLPVRGQLPIPEWLITTPVTTLVPNKPCIRKGAAITVANTTIHTVAEAIMMLKAIPMNAEILATVANTVLVKIQPEALVQPTIHMKAGRKTMTPVVTHVVPNVTIQKAMLKLRWKGVDFIKPL